VLVRLFSYRLQATDSLFGCNPVSCQARMHELAQSRSGLGGRIIWMDRLEWRRRRVFQ
jgi:hypothetical protein